MSYSMDEQSLRLLKTFVNIDDPDMREMIITVAKFAESRERKKSKAVDDHVVLKSSPPNAA